MFPSIRAAAVSVIANAANDPLPFKSILLVPHAYRTINARAETIDRAKGALHQQHQKGEYNGNHRDNQERVEIGKSQRLLFAKILQRL